MTHLLGVDQNLKVHSQQTELKAHSHLKVSGVKNEIV